jgi:hypothetical protein
MAHEVEDADAVIDELAADTALDVDGRCAIFEELVRSRPPVAQRGAALGCAPEQTARGH